MKASVYVCVLGIGVGWSGVGWGRVGWGRVEGWGDGVGAGDRQLFS